MQTLPAEYSDVSAVTPSDTAQVFCRALYIGGAGDIAIKPKGGTAATFKAPPVGTIIPMNLEGGQVMATNTTATLILALR